MSVYDLWRPGDVPDRFGQIYSQCQRSMFAYALRLTGGDYDLAEDVTQEAFVRIAREDVRRIADCIRRLPVKYREVFYLYFVDNLSLREVADELKLPADTVRRRFSRGKQLLVRELEKGGVRNDA